MQTVASGTQGQTAPECGKLGGCNSWRWELCALRYGVMAVSAFSFCCDMDAAGQRAKLRASLRERLPLFEASMDADAVVNQEEGWREVLLT